jgi:glycosyltransferase involved in cell wall biosynthesis
MAASDVFVLPSQTEGLPIALLEAMSAGLPVVASAVGGIPSVVETEREALLVPPNDEDALHDALQRILADPALGQTLGRRARERFVAAYTADAMASRYDDLYRDVLGS